MSDIKPGSAQSISAGEYTAARKWGTMLAVGLAIFMSTLDVTIVQVTLPTLVRDLNTDFTTIQWVVLGYVLAVTSLILSFARAGDMYGKRRLYLVGVALFTLGSLLCGLAPSVGWLIAFRVLQGIGAAFNQALGMALITEAFPPQERGRALGMMGSVVSIGLAMGPAVGGLIIGYWSWRVIFLVNIPVGVVCLWAIRRFVASVRPAVKPPPFDLAGAASMVGTLVAYALAMTLGQDEGFLQTKTLVLLVLVLIGLVLFLRIETRADKPLVDLGLFKNPLLSLNLSMAFLAFVAIGGFMVIPFFLELVLFYPPQVVGLFLMVFPAMMGLAAPVAGALSDRWGSRGICLAGLLIAAAGCFTIAILDPGMDYWQVALLMAPFGLGIGVFQAPNNSVVLGSVPKTHLGITSGFLALTRTLGQTTGIPLLGAVFGMIALAESPGAPGVTDAGISALTHALTGTFHVAAGLVGISVCLAAYAWWLSGRRKSPPSPGPDDS